MGLLYVVHVGHSTTLYLGLYLGDDLDCDILWSVWLWGACESVSGLVGWYNMIYTGGLIG